MIVYISALFIDIEHLIPDWLGLLELYRFSYIFDFSSTELKFTKDCELFEEFLDPLRLNKCKLSKKTYLAKSILSLFRILFS